MGRRQPTSNPRAPQTFAYYERIPAIRGQSSPTRSSEEIDGLAKVVVPLLTGLPAVFSEGFPGAFFAKNSAHKIAFLTGSGPKREVIVNKGLNPV